MNYIEEQGDLFTVPKHYYLAHCISSDAAMGRGIAVEFNKRYDMKRKVLRHPEMTRKYPTCILEGRVFNLITKGKYHEKPTYETLHHSLLVMKAIAEDRDIKNIAMPAIGAGLDKLEWNKVRVMVENIFEDSNINILIRMKKS